MAALKRIRKELGELSTNPPAHCSAGPIDEDDLFLWGAVIMGPMETPFAGGSFHLEIKFPQKYPFQAVEVKFRTKIYHPNISDLGTVCMDILKPGAWSPIFSISKGIFYLILRAIIIYVCVICLQNDIVLMCILSLMTDPNPDDAYPSREEMAIIYRTDRAKYNENAKEWTAKYAI